jgi:pyridoxamine 5'-phosphate oxidase
MLHANANRIMIPISNATSQYTRGALNLADLDPDPIRQFGKWLEAAVSAQVPEPSAMTLATASRTGVPSARIVLLKLCDERGFAFFTNCESQKGLELAENPMAALVFFWPTLERQVRVVGTVAETSREEAETYFHSRPFGSQVGAWASHQSQVVRDREELDHRARQCALEFENKVVPMPPYWGGYRVFPTAIEFWQGRANRLHDRFRYAREAESSWAIVRLSP